MKWWAYLHENGSIQLKRYFDDSYKQDCIESEFVIKYTSPFNADNQEDALKVAQEIWGNKNE